MSNSENLINLLTTSNQPITFADYMGLVLYQPEFGYYGAGNVQIGSLGDFFTSSSLGADFGELLAKQLLEIWQILDYPQPFTLVEMGAGSGNLTQDILSYLDKNYSDFFGALEYIIIEQAPALIKIQQDLLKLWSSKVSWQSWDNISDNSIIGCFFSNELIDAFPVHQIIIKNQQIHEIYVTIEDGQLKEIIAQPSTPEITKYFQWLNIDIQTYPEGYRTEVNLAALDWLSKISRCLAKGYVITVDYGYTAQKYYHPQRSQGTLQCYYQHRCHHNPYVNLGCQDITSHVNFTALELHGESLGLQSIGFTQQALFLMNLGLGDRLIQLSSGKFKLEEIFSRRDALHQLIDPTGLGGFGVLIQSQGLSDLELYHKLTGLSRDETLTVTNLYKKP